VLKDALPGSADRSGHALIVKGVVEPMELGHLSYKEATYEDYLGTRGLERLGLEKWREYIAEVVGRLMAALQLDDVIVGGGNVRNLDKLPQGCRAGDNSNAFREGFLLWEKVSDRRTAIRAKAPSRPIRGEEGRTNLKSA
jgi:polyphosphate glucokinase